MSILSRITGRQHHFKVVLRYYPDQRSAGQYVERNLNIWMRDRALIANDREIKKFTCTGLFRDMPEQMKRNGMLELREVYYLGWFRPVKPKKKQRTLDELMESYFVYLAMKSEGGKV